MQGVVSNEKMYFFLIYTQNIDCEYSNYLEPPEAV